MQRRTQAQPTGNQCRSKTPRTAACSTLLRGVRRNVSEAKEKQLAEMLKPLGRALSIKAVVIAQLPSSFQRVGATGAPCLAPEGWSHQRLMHRSVRWCRVSTLRKSDLPGPLERHVVTSYSSRFQGLKGHVLEAKALELTASVP